MLGLGEHEDPAVLRARAREKFVAKRTLEEQRWDKWRNALINVPVDKIAAKLSFPLTDLTLQNLVPEWYKDLPNAQIASAQVQEANQKIAQVNQIILELNKEGIKLLEEYNAIN